MADGTSLDDLLVPAFATVREAAKRTLGQRHFDVQLIGGMVLHDGKIAEMKTGEGKTLVATLPVYLNALAGKGVHVVTVNDYLASRDAEWMGQVYKFLGLTVGCIVHGIDDEERRAAYACDVTYGTNNEFGFDYLRDNMKYHLEEMVQRGHHYAIVDEVDSILIDEARTPLIISGPVGGPLRALHHDRRLIPELAARSDYEKDEKHAPGLAHRARQRTHRGNAQGGRHAAGRIALRHRERDAGPSRQPGAAGAQAVPRATATISSRNDKVVIIDEFTGRMMEGRRYSDGLHQALEAKEQVTIQPENQTLASITFQNYFRLYDKLAGMTGTAVTEAAEFARDLQARRRRDPDQPCRWSAPTRTTRSTARRDEKNEAIVDEIDECRKRGQPVLVGTVSIEKSEALCGAAQEEARSRTTC